MKRYPKEKKKCINRRDKILHKVIKMNDSPRKSSLHSEYKLFRNQIVLKKASEIFIMPISQQIIAIYVKFGKVSKVLLM